MDDSAEIAMLTDADHDAGLAAQRHDRIAVAAFLLAEARGFVPGQELDDWLRAERQIDMKPASSVE